MIRVNAVLAAIVLPVSSAFAQQLDTLQMRLMAFENAQLVCKAAILSNRDAAVSFVRSNSGTLSDRCECAAILTVSNKSDTQIREMLSSTDSGPAAAFAEDVRRSFVQCVRMN